MVDQEQTFTETEVHDHRASLLEADAEEWRLELDRLIESSDFFRQISLDFSRYIHKNLISNGEEVREMADFLHGKPLGHALHPILTDITIGSWTLSLLFDVLGVLPGFRDIRKSADLLNLIGIISAVPTAITGAVDYSAIKKDAVSYGAAHGLLNSIALMCFTRSAFARLTGSRSTAMFYSLLGTGLLTASAWLGGDLVYRHRVGVNHVPDTQLEDWAPLMPVEDLPEGEPTGAEVNGVSVLLFRQDDTIYAINAVCSHAGGPLAEGRVVNNVCIQCPWHQSVFDMHDGQVVHSPATFPQPEFEVRIREGQVEIRSAAIL